MKVREKAILPNQLYSDNKVKIKKMYKAHDLKFNQGALHSAQCFLWQGDKQQVEGQFTKDGNGLTVHSELIITADERTPIFDELKELVEEIGGSWEIVGDEELQKEHDDFRASAILSFESDMFNKLFQEERDARKKNFEHCPVIKPMITELLQKRYDLFELKDLSSFDVLAEVYATVDSEAKKCSHCDEVKPGSAFSDMTYNGECEECYIEISIHNSDYAVGR